MNRPIRLDVVRPAADMPRRLDVFAGRHLGEREFDLLQAYADARLAPLLTGAAPGIVAGLEASLDVADPRLTIRVRPGHGIGADGRPVRLHYPLEQTWPQLLEHAERELDGKLRDGLYFLELTRAVELADADPDGDPCRRTEPDPLRDRRIETVARLGLRFVTAGKRFMIASQTRAANRLCVRFLSESPFDAVAGGVPLALVKVVKREPVWFDAVAGRFPALPDGPYRTFLAHTQAVLEAYAQRLAAEGRQPDETKTLAEQLDLDHLPAAGPLPAALLRNPGGDPGGKPGEQPALAFAPRDLQVELMPVPASTVAGMVGRELPRGTVDLASGRGDRVRLTLAVADPDYRPNLMDLPQPDLKLEQELAERSQAAIDAWQAWKAQWLVLFHGLTEAQARTVQVPPLPANEGAFLAGLTARAGVDAMVEQRRHALKPGEDLPHPYSDWQTKPRLAPQTVTPLEGTEVGLHRQRLDLVARIDDLEGELQENYRLLNELTDYLGLQRQQLDAITVSFSSLAGGVPGDGSGLNLMRWARYAEFQPKPQKG